MGTHNEGLAVLPSARPSSSAGQVSLPSLMPQGQGELLDGLARGCGTSTKVRIASLVRAETPRSGGEDRAHIQRLVQVEGPWPPIIVHRATMKIIDGFHRVCAAVEKGLDEIDAVLLDEPWESAFLLAVRANVTHGLPLSLADRRAAASKIVRTHSELSDRAIAIISGLSPRTVRAIRCSSAEAPQVEKRIGRDGRVRPLNAAVGRQLAADYFEAHPDASLREIATAVGISPGTVRDVRARLHRGDDPVLLPAAENREAHRRIRRTPSRSVSSGPTQPADVNPVLATLSKDPALRMNDAGRDLLRWLRLHAVNTVDSAKIVQTVPDHCVEHLVQLATRCSANWARIAHDLAQRSQQRCESEALSCQEPDRARQCS